MQPADVDDQGRPWVDPELARGLDHPAATAALQNAARSTGRRYELDRWFLNGRSGAQVCTLHELGPAGDRRLILKLDRLDDGLVQHGEFSRHRKALRDGEGTKFHRRLATLPGNPPSPPIAVGDGYWLAFQNVAGGNLAGMVVLTSLLAGVRGATLNPALRVVPTPCDRGLFAEICATVIGGVLSEWAEHPTRLTHRASARAFNASEFIQLFLRPRLDPGEPLRAHAEAVGLGPTIELPGEPRPLVNPFALALNPNLAPQASIHILSGKAHGDLNPENVLLRTDTVAAAAEPDYFLVDLSRYSAKAPLTRDPTNLLLTIVANTMNELLPPAREALLDVLVDPGSSQRSMLPVWLNVLLSRATHRALDWAEDHGYGDEWWRQSRLTLVPCAMRIMARSWLDQDEKAWFLRLAARAADAHLDEVGGPRRAPAAADSLRVARPTPVTAVRASANDTRLVGITPVPTHVLSGHRGLIRAVAFSPDGTHLATASTDRTVRIWDAATGAHLRTLTGHTGLVLAVAWAPDSVLLATVSDDTSLRIWDGTTSTRRRTGHRYAVHAVTYSPDGTLLATASADGMVRIADARTGTHLYSLIGHAGPVMSVTYSPDAAQLATAGYDSTARLWRASDGECVRTLSGHDGPVNAAAYSPSGTHLATASSDGTVRTWLTATGRNVTRFAGHTGTVFALAYSPDGTQLASGADDGTVRIWHATTGRLRHTLTGHGGTVFDLAYSPDGTHLATACADETVRIWRVADERAQAARPASVPRGRQRRPGPPSDSVTEGARPARRESPSA